MNKEVDLSKYQIRTDLAIDELEEKIKLKGVKSKYKEIDNIKVTEVILEEKNELAKKKGNYITLEFDDITDSDNANKVMKVLTTELSKILKIVKDSYGLVVGLGNNKSTPDSLGPLTINNIIVTNHIYIMDKLSDNYKRLSAINPVTRPKAKSLEYESISPR